MSIHVLRIHRSLKFFSFASYMTNSTEFDIGEDELGSDNLLRRSIEDAISHQRQITLGEYHTFMSTIGGLVPGYVK